MSVAWPVAHNEQARTEGTEQDTDGEEDDEQELRHVSTTLFHC